jgi:hypothetical protein
VLGRSAWVAHRTSTDWGDGTSSAGYVSGPDTNGRFTVTGSHIYPVLATNPSSPQRFALQVTVDDAGGAGTHAVSTAVIGDANARFVAAAELDVLGRPVDPLGLVYWDAQLDGGQPRSVVANLIDHSAEYFGAVIVTPAYNKYLGRLPDTGGLGYWVDQMQHHGLTDERLEAGFIGSQEFYQRAGATDPLWVDALYEAFLGRPADSMGKAFWVAQLAGRESRSEVAYGFAASLERERQRISDDYLHYLGRLPDQQGIDYWVSQFAGGVTNEDLITGFVASDEYFKQHTS